MTESERKRTTEREREGVTERDTHTQSDSDILREKRDIVTEIT